MPNVSTMQGDDCISTDQFKAVMRRFAAGVNVITSADGELLNGMTATAVCSVSADPPSLLVIVNKSNRSHPIISRSRVFAVNVLASDQEHVASHFSSKAQDPFATIPHTIGRTKCPIIDEVDAFLECEVVAETDFGTHTIFIGQIVDCSINHLEPLLYHAGRFRALEAGAPAHA